MKPTAEQFERLTTEIVLGIPRERSMYASQLKTDTEFVASYDLLSREVADIQASGNQVKIAEEVPQPLAGAEKRSRLKAFEPLSNPLFP